MTTPIAHQPNSDLLDELRRSAAELPRWRLHVHPDSAMWISISVQGTGLSPYVRVVPDPDCREVGKGWIETLTVDQWRELRAQVGHLVVVETAELGALAGTLRALDHSVAQVDLGDGDIRYLPWITVTPIGDAEAGQ